MKKILIFVVAAMFACAGLTVTGCKKGDELKPVHKAERKKGKTSSKKSTKTQSTKQKSSQKKGEPPESMM